VTERKYYANVHSIKIAYRVLPELNSNSIFMQDGTPCHRSRSTLRFLENHGMCLLSDWPAQSLDLNIIENLWATLKKNVTIRYPKNKEVLWVILQKEWTKVDSSEVRKLYDSFPRRLQDVIKEKGLHFKYWKHVLCVVVYCTINKTY